MSTPWPRTWLARDMDEREACEYIQALYGWTETKLIQYRFFAPPDFEMALSNVLSRWGKLKFCPVLELTKWRMILRGRDRS